MTARAVPWIRIGLAVAIVVAVTSTLRSCSASDRARAADAALEVSQDSTRQVRAAYVQDSTAWAGFREASLERERELAADTARLSREVEEARGRVGDAVDAADVAGADLDDAIGVLVELAPPELAPVVGAIADARAAERTAIAVERFEHAKLAGRLTRRGDSLAALLMVVARDRDEALDQVSREQELRRNVERDLALSIVRGDAYRDAARAWKIGTGAATAAAILAGVVIIAR